MLIEKCISSLGAFIDAQNQAENVNIQQLNNVWHARITIYNELTAIIMYTIKLEIKCDNVDLKE